VTSTTEGGHIRMTDEQPTEDLAATLHDQLTSLIGDWSATAEPMNHGDGHGSGAPALPSSTITLRADITLTLAYWVHAFLDAHPDAMDSVIGGTLDCTDVPAMADLLRDQRHVIAGWDEYGATLTAELQPLVDHARLVARPPRRDKTVIGPCPVCGFSVQAKGVRWVRLPIPTSNPSVLAPWTPWQPERDQVITCRGCQRTDTITGWRHAMLGTEELLSADELVEQIHAHFGLRYSPITIRVWARRGLIQPAGYRWDGRAVYDRVQVFAALTDRETRRGP
jgi:hypothetical protein